MLNNFVENIVSFAIDFFMGPPKRDGVIGHISKREFVNWMKEFQYCVIWYPLARS